MSSPSHRRGGAGEEPPPSVEAKRRRRSRHPQPKPSGAGARNALVCGAVSSHQTPLGLARPIRAERCPRRQKGDSCTNNGPKLWAVHSSCTTIPDGRLTGGCAGGRCEAADITSRRPAAHPSADAIGKAASVMATTSEPPYFRGRRRRVRHLSDATRPRRAHDGRPPSAANDVGAGAGDVGDGAYIGAPVRPM